MKPLLTLAVLLCAGPALAAGSATVQTTSPQGAQAMQVTWQDVDTARMDLPGQAGYMVVRDGEAFVVSSAGGRTMVLAMSGMAAMADSMGAGGGASVGAMMDRHTATGVERLEATGAGETVAGLRGEVYEMVWTDATGASRTDTLVLSDAPLAVEFTAAMQAFARAMGEDEDPRARAVEGHGLLRYGERFRLTEISASAPAAEAFTLPAPPISMEDMMQGRMPGQQ
jgi:hypothetical protein